MGTESDADRIQREKDRRRAEERLRIEREHHRRLHDVEALRRTGPHPAPEPPETGPLEVRPAPPPPAPEPKQEAEGPAEPSPAPAPNTPPPQKTPNAKASPSPRTIGRPVRSSAVEAFLAMDPAEQFDIEALNRLPLTPLLQEGAEEPELLAAIAERSELLMERVKKELDDPLNAGALLRELALEWYRNSPEDAAWTESASARWAGLFADTKVSGGSLHPWLNARLWAIHQRSVREGPVRHRVRRGISRSKVAEYSVIRTAVQQIQAEVAQAFLDDLASHPRKPESPFPLVRLSELAVRRQVATVNDALAALFSSAETGPFVLLHPNRYPDCEELQIRPPVGGASGAALAFTLVSPRSARRPSGKGSGGPSHLETGSEGEPSEAPASPEVVLDAETVWTASEVPPAAWRAVLEECHQGKRRLDSPPRDYRTKPSYLRLRELILQDTEVRRTFLAVKWRGRPAGLPLLALLLQKGTMAPEVATDHEYLEAELGEISQGDPHFVPENGVWKLPGWTVTREGTHRDGLRYRAVAG